MSRLLTFVLLIGLLTSCFFLVRRLQSYPLPGNQQGYEPEQPIAFSHRQHAGDLQIACLYCHSGAEHGKQAGVPPASICMSCHRSVTASQKDMLPHLLRRKANKAPKAIISPELQKLYESLGLGDKPELFDPNKRNLNRYRVFANWPGQPRFELHYLDDKAEAESLAARFRREGAPDVNLYDHTKEKPIRWVKVHNLPAYACFDHRSHVQSGVTCQQCHGEVDKMDRLRQVSDLSMGWCVNCHRDAGRNGVNGKKVKPSTDCVTCHY